MVESATETAIFTLRKQSPPGIKQRIVNLLIKPVEQLVSLKKCNDIYNRLLSKESPQAFFKSVRDILDVSLAVDPKEKAGIPRKGPLVVVANHPFGAIEGIILSELLLSVRPDIKVMANFMLNRIPQMRDLVISVDPFSSSKATRANIAPVREAIKWVENGGALLVFPSGTVSHVKITRREISDPPWSPGVSRIIRKAQAPVLPIYFGGANGKLFQTLGLIHPTLRTAMLPRELLNKRRRKIEMKIGKVVPYRHLERFPSDKELASYLRWRTYLLGRASGRSGFSKSGSGEQEGYKRPVAAPLEPAICREEVVRLPRRQLLLESGAYEIWQASSPQIPRLLMEIGRLREHCFRQVGEGTGRALDLDRFDSHYVHIFIWNREKDEIAGAYRLGCTDTILRNHGQRGLYTTTLFHSNRHFYDRIGPALELGRSFVRPEYQKSYAPLLLLWKGIGQFVARNPKYRMLFGPVSISRDYSDLSRQLIATTLLRHNQAGDIAALVSPKTPPSFKPVRIKGCKPDWQAGFCRHIEEVNDIVTDIESDNKGIPVLLRHYLKLGGQLLAFNVDRDFNDTLDGLIVVDLYKNDRKTLERYLGKEGAEGFYNYHAFLNSEALDGLSKTA